MRLQGDALPLGSRQQIAKPRYGRVATIGTHQHFRDEIFSLSGLNFPATAISQRCDRCLFTSLRAKLARALQQELIEKTPFNRELALVAGRKIGNHSMTANRNELDALQLCVREGLGAVGEIEPVEHSPAGWIQTVAANFFPWKFFALKNQCPQTGLCAKCCAARSSRPAAHDCNIKVFHVAAHRKPSILLMSNRFNSTGVQRNSRAD